MDSVNFSFSTVSTQLPDCGAAIVARLSLNSIQGEHAPVPLELRQTLVSRWWCHSKTPAGPAQCSCS